MLYYNICMNEHVHLPGQHSHHHHHPDHHHPPAAVHASILRLSAAQRLGFAAVLIALLWAAVLWATR